MLSYWCGPPATADIDKRYAEVAECHFNYAMIPCNGNTSEQAKAALAACSKYGLKYMPADSRLMARGPADTVLQPIWMRSLASMPVGQGWWVYFGDEPSAGAFPQLGAVNQYLLKKDPGHLPFINLYPNHAPDWALGHRIMKSMSRVPHDC